MQRAGFLWPGLPQLWQHGSWAGLTLALGFIGLANLLVLTTFVWIEWMPQRVRLAGWVLLAAVWIVAWIAQRRRETESSSNSELDVSDRAAGAIHDGRLMEAQTHYLRGQWVEAERLLVDMLSKHADDAEARLLLATLCRHQERVDEAADHLNALERREAAQRWRFEIAQERIRLAEVADTQNDTRATANFESNND